MNNNNNTSSSNESTPPPETTKIETDAERTEATDTPTEEQPKKRGFLNTKGKKITAIVAAAALVLGGGGGAAWAITDANRTKAYDANVEQAQELAAEAETLSRTLTELVYLRVDGTKKFEGSHVKQLTTISKTSDKLIKKETLEPVVKSVKELAEQYTATEEKADKKDKDKKSDEKKDAEKSDEQSDKQKDPYFTVDDNKLFDELNKQFKEEKTLTSLLIEVVAAPKSSTELDARPTDTQIAEAERAVESNQKTVDGLNEAIKGYEDQLDELDARVIADAALLEKPIEEALKNVNDFIKGWDKADDKTKKALSATTKKLQEVLKQYQSGELAKPEKDEKADDKKADDKKKDEKEEKPEPTIFDEFAYEHEPADAVQLELSTDLREQFVKFISDINAYKKSHDEKVAAEAAAAAAAAGAAEYQDPSTGAWVPTPAPSYGGGNGYAGGGNTWNGGGGSTWGGGSTGGGGGYVPPATGGGGGGVKPPTGGGGGGNTGGGGGGGTTPPPPRTCPAQPANTFWDGGTYTIDGLTCKQWIPYGDDDW